MQVTILTESELRQCIDVDEEAIAVIEDGFSRLAAGDVTMPPIMRVPIPESNGEVDSKTAYVRGLDSFALKVSSGFFDNPKLGLPSGSGLMMLLSTKTGMLQALLLDNGYLTDVRTGAAGAVVAKHLAREDISTAGVIGAGAQGRYQMRALKLVRDYEKLLVFDRDSERAAAYVEAMSDALGVPVEAAPDAGAVVRNSDVVVTTTPAKQGYLQADWLHPGLHITAMGTDAEEKQELQPDVFKHAGLIVCDSKAQVFKLGELQRAVEAGVAIDEDAVVELGEITSGQHPGRTDADTISVCDLTGTGMQDTAIARLAFEKAKAQGFGTTFEV